MIFVNNNTCPICNSELRFYDNVTRILKVTNGRKRYLQIRRLKCQNCSTIHRELPTYVYPYKHYSKTLMNRVLDGSYSDIWDYPSVSTINRWFAQYLHIVL